MPIQGKSRARSSRFAPMLGCKVVASIVALGLMGVAVSAAAQGAAPAEQTSPAAAAPVPAPSAAAPAKSKSAKAAYRGPTDIVVLAPAPMLDGEGKQRVDPDGKPMFNLPVKQIRDKKGHPVFDSDGKPVFQTATELGYDEHLQSVGNVLELMQSASRVLYEVRRGQLRTRELLPR